MRYLFLITIISLFTITAFADAQPTQSISVQKKIETLEKSFDGKIGIYAINTNNNQIIAYRANEDFPLQSTMKLIGVSALLKQSDNDKNMLKEKINYTKDDLVYWHPVTGKYITSGMTLEALSEAAISFSDNTAMNLIIKKLGGPKSVSEFAHSIGNKSFNVDHNEDQLNSNAKDMHETYTSTPKDMAMSLQKLTLGNILAPTQRTQLVTWMVNNTTGYKRIRAGVPIGWIVADKTGGCCRIANDIGIIWSPISKPIVLAIYTIQNNQDAKSRDEVVAATTSIILDEFAKTDSFFKELSS